jgi:hypothetical protein
MLRIVPERENNVGPGDNWSEKGDADCQNKSFHYNGVFRPAGL